MFRRRERIAREVREEIRFYLEMRTRELEEQGLTPEEAAREALAAFGDPDRIEREVTTMTMRRTKLSEVGRWTGALLQDLRYAGRFLVRNPGFALVVLATLALGIGANTAIFSLMDQALLRAPSVRDPGSLVAVYTTSRRGFPRSSSSYPDYVDYRDRTAALADLAGTSTLPVSLGDDERGAQLITVEIVTGNFFPLLGVSAAHGRLIAPDDDAMGAGRPVTVLSNSLWRDVFAADPGVVGTAIRLNGQPYDVIGVVDASYRGLALGAEPDAWVPMQAAAPIAAGWAVSDEAIFQERGARWMGRLVGRLGESGTVERARSELLALSDALREQDPEARGERSVTVDPLGRYLLPLGNEASLRRFVWLLVGVVGATLLLASANLANLLLARATTRRGEIGVRLAIGAGRGRLLRQLLAESLSLALLGGALGLAVARGLLAALSAYELPGGVPIGALGVGIDARVLLATLGLALLTALFFGLVPALHATRPEMMSTLRSGPAERDRPSGERLRGGLVTAQVALCLVLLVGSGLFIRTLRNALGADVGIETANVAVSRFNLGTAGYDAAAASSFVQSLRDRVAATPGVESTVVSTLIPFQGGGFMGTFFGVDGYEPEPDEELRTDLVFTTPGFFETLGAELEAGRDFDGSDVEGATDVGIVSRSMADRYWPAGNAVGGTVLFGESAVTVVGVADDIRWSSLDGEITNFVFLPLAQSPSRAANSFLTVAARTRAAPEVVLPELRSSLRSLDSDVSPSFVLTMDALVGGLLMPQRLGALLLSALGLLALLLATIGIVGVVSYRVREQRRALGVRIALGARPDELLRLVMGGVARPLALGIALGLAVAIALRDTVAGFLFEVPSGDPVTYAVVVGILAGVALLAGLVPAREAARVDPIQVLRSE